MEGDGLVPVGVAEDVEDGGEGLAADVFGLAVDLDECGADVEGVGGGFGVDALASGDGGSGGAEAVEGLLHGFEGLAVDEWTYEGAGIAWVADLDGAVDLFELRDEGVVYGVMHDEAAQGRAALSGGAHGGEGDAAEGEVDVGGGGDDGGVVAAELEDGAGEAGGEARAYGSAHGGGAGG